MEWSFWIAIAVVVLVVASMLIWPPKEPDDLDDAIEQYRKQRKR